MNSGIYKLTFSSGRFYVGKSIDIPTRWKQHEDKFAKGTAAVRMQQEFDQCGSPHKEVLIHCHADHIDIIETWMIDTHYQEHGNMMLNATYAEAIPDQDRLKVNRGIHLLSLSTPDHIEMICDLQEAAVKAAEEVKKAKKKVKKYQEMGILVPQEVLDMREELEWCKEQRDDLEAESNQLAQAVIDLRAEVYKLQKRSWWSRLFG